jgi:type II secretory pathway pseudopilin PulG
MLLEALLASLLIGVVAVVLGSVLTRTMHQTRENEIRELAWQVFDRQLTLMETMGTEAFIAESGSEGETTAAELPFTWSAEVETELFTDLLEVELTVSWQEGTRRRSISGFTYLNN